MTRVVITGYGGICSLGHNTDQIWKNILDKKLGYENFGDLPPSIKSKFFGRVSDPLPIDGISRRVLKNSPRFAQLALGAAHEAMKMAFPDNSLKSHYRDLDCGTIIGTGWGGVDSIAANVMAYGMGEMSTQACFQAMPNIATSVVSVNWGLRGYQNTPIAACATGNIAIGDAYHLIKNGTMRFMIAGGSETAMSAFSIWAIDIMSALSKEATDQTAACCPFDRRRSGFILSEGAAVVCLESLESAERRGAKIFGEVIGYANQSDAWPTLSAPAPDVTAKVETLRNAMNEAGISGEDIDYINAHGTSTPANDISETVALKEALGQRAYDIPVSSTKSYTGHLIAATGSMETIFCLKAMEHNIAPATANIKEPDPQCDLNYIPNDHLYNYNMNTIMNVNYGFGGSNSCLVIRRF